MLDDECSKSRAYSALIRSLVPDTARLDADAVASKATAGRMLTAEEEIWLRGALEDGAQAEEEAGCTREDTAGKMCGGEGEGEGEGEELDSAFADHSKQAYKEGSEKMASAAADDNVEDNAITAAAASDDVTSLTADMSEKLTSEETVTDEVEAAVLAAVGADISVAVEDADAPSAAAGCADSVEATPRSFDDGADSKEV